MSGSDFTHCRVAALLDVAHKQAPGLSGTLDAPAALDGLVQFRKDHLDIVRIECRERAVHDNGGRRVKAHLGRRRRGEVDEALITHERKHTSVFDR